MLISIKIQKVVCFETHYCIIDSSDRNSVSSKSSVSESEDTSNQPKEVDKPASSKRSKRPSIVIVKAETENSNKHIELKYNDQEIDEMKGPDIEDNEDNDDDYDNEGEGGGKHQLIFEYIIQMMKALMNYCS